MSPGGRGHGQPGRCRRGTGGFTLIELILILGLLGLLASVAVPRFHDASVQAKVIATQDRLHLLRRAIAGEARPGAPLVPGYRGDVGRWPTRLGDLFERPHDVPAWNPFARRGWNGPYLESARDRAGRRPGLSDAWGHPVRYENANGVVRLVSPGPDGIPGTADDITLTLE